MLAKSISSLVAGNEKAGPLPCAIVQGGAEIALFIEAREGRFPAQVTLISEPLIGWVCADGVHEHVEIKGSNGAADFHAIKEQCQGQGLLVGEVGDLASPDTDSAVFSLVHVSPPPTDFVSASAPV